VVFLHSFPNARGPIGDAGFGAAGVDLFFVISGFIMANVSKGRSTGGFLRDRMWRIYPLWWVAVIPWLFFLPREWQFTASSLSLWPIYGGSYYVPVLLVGWTLSFELLFYCGMTLALATRAAVPLALYALCLAGALTGPSPMLHFVGSPMAIEFLLGVVVAQLPRRAALGLLIPAGIALIGTAAPETGLIAAALDPATAIWRVVQWGLPAALILWGALSLEPLFEHRLFNLPVAIGDASYSIYLFHPLVAYGFNLLWPARFALAVGLGWTMHLVVERRIMRFGRSGPPGSRLISRRSVKHA
jgi:peptidoglycan/LPS O-acetylase OafA/YrhL